MKYHIKKINQLFHTDSFMQINYLRGFKYIDKAGEIVNSFFLGNAEPLYQMTQRDLLIKYSSYDSRDYRISVNNIWSHDSSPKNLGDLENDFLKKSIEILSILGTNEIVRVGWRNYFVYEFQDLKDKNTIFSKFLPIKDSDFLTIVFKKSIKNVNCKFFIKGAENAKKKTPAIIFDIDCFKSFNSSSIKPKEISGNLKEIKEIYYSDIMLDVINNVLKININPGRHNNIDHE